MNVLLCTWMQECLSDSKDHFSFVLISSCANLSNLKLFYLQSLKKSFCCDNEI
ncbi:unnamed protein product [Brassica oleracea var. botrytis]